MTAVGPQPVPRPSLPPGPYVVVGLARSGVAVALQLAARRELVTGVDSTGVGDDDRRALEAAGVAVRAPDDGLSSLSGAVTLVKSPGVPREAPVVAEALGRGMTVCGEIEMAWRMLPNRFLAVTGSNGKTTTVELIGHVFRTAGQPVRVAGNVGTAVSGLVGTVGAEETIVCEVSSFQLEDTLAFAPEAAVLLNVTPDHLDRHGTFEAYREAKLRIFAAQPPGAIAIRPGETGSVGDDGWIVAPDGERLMPASEIRLRGAHNVQNAMAAAAVCLAWGLPAEAVREGLRTFAGVRHRLEEIASIGGVLYVNDSKATNVDAAVTGISSFPRGVHAILGGQGKGGDFTPITEALRGRTAAVHLIGARPSELAAAARAAGVPVHESGDLETAVAAATRAAEPGDVVLLSPACASFDQYTNYEHRGDHFRDIVLRLRG